MLFWRTVISIFFLNSKMYRTMLQDSFSEHLDPPTSLLCFSLFNGYLLSRGSNASCLCFAWSFLVISCVFVNPSVYLLEFINLYSPSRQLRSSADTRVFRLPSFRTESSSQRSFFYQAPVVGNQLFVSVHHSTSVSSFKSSLKTFLQSHLPWYTTLSLSMRVCVCVLNLENMYV